MTDKTANLQCDASESSGGTPAELEIKTDADRKVDAVVRQVLCDVLGLDTLDVSEFDEDTGLFGHLPELDSMAVAGLLTEMEDRLDIIIDDDDVDGEMLETFGGLLDFAIVKVEEG